MIRSFPAFALLPLALAGGCASIPLMGNPAVSVTAMAETVPVGTANDDAADDPAIWRNPADPAASLVVGTDKKGGLYVYDLKGREKSYLPATGLNNVDLVEINEGGVLVIASDRSDPVQAKLFLALLDPTTGGLTPAGAVRVGPGEGYGICIAKPVRGNQITVFSAPKNGVIYRTSLMPGTNGGFAGTTTMLATVPSQPEGCVADPRTGTLYIGEEAAGIWAIAMDSGDKRLVAPVDGRMLVADVEGLAIAPEGSDGGHLIASSQGDNAYAVFRLPGMEPVGRFRIGEGAFGSTEETDGIELDIRDFGPDFPGGIFIAQDGVNPPEAQNFKYARWDEILAALQKGFSADGG